MTEGRVIGRGRGLEAEVGWEGGLLGFCPEPPGPHDPCSPHGRV